MQSEIFQLQSRSYAIKCIDQRFAFKNSGIAYLVLKFNWNNPRTTILHAKKAIPGCEKLRVIYCFFQETRKLIRTFGSVIKAASRRMLKLFAVPLPFLREPVNTLTHALLYCCAVYNFYFLGFRQWRSRADRVLTLNMNIRLPLFWSTWSRARGPDSAICAGLAHGWMTAIAEPWSKSHKRCLAIIFLELSKIIENHGPR